MNNEAADAGGRAHRDLFADIARRVGVAPE